MRRAPEPDSAGPSGAGASRRRRRRPRPARRRLLPADRDCGIRSIERAEYTLFQDAASSTRVSKGDWYGFYGGIEYNQVREQRRARRPFRRLPEDDRHLLSRLHAADGGDEIFQTLRLRTWPLGVSLRLGPTGRARRSRPTWGRRGRDHLPVRGVRRLHRLLRSRPGDHSRQLHRTGGLRVPRAGRAAGLRQPRLRDRGGGRYQWARTRWTTTSRPTPSRSTWRAGPPRSGCTSGSDAPGAQGGAERPPLLGPGRLALVRRRCPLSAVALLRPILAVDERSAGLWVPSQGVRSTPQAPRGLPCSSDEALL